MQDWMSKGLCKDLSPEEADDLFFIGPGKSAKRALLFCQQCPVKRECSNFAITYSEYGIWAGSTEEDRKSLDTFIKDTLRAQAEAEGKLESRNLNDFIPQQRRPVEDFDPLREIELVEQALWEAQLEAPDHLFEEPNDPQAFGL